MIGLSGSGGLLPEFVRNLIGKPVQLQSSPFRVEGLYVTDTGAIIRLTENEGGDHSLMIRERLASVIGSVTRIVSDLLNQAGVMVPCFCVVRAAENSPLVQAAYDLAMDQDWNRGDFALLLETEDTMQDDGVKPQERIISETLLDFDHTSLGISMDPVSRKDVVRRYRESVKALNLSPDHEELTDIICKCLGSEADPFHEMQNWVRQKKEEIQEMK